MNINDLSVAKIFVFNFEPLKTNYIFKVELSFWRKLKTTFKENLKFQKGTIFFLKKLWRYLCYPK